MIPLSVTFTIFLLLLLNVILAFGATVTPSFIFFPFLIVMEVFFTFSVGFFTLMVQTALYFPMAAFITAMPAFLAVTTPLLETAATDGLEELHFTFPLIAVTVAFSFALFAVFV